jgi:hypothetical protein
MQLVLLRVGIDSGAGGMQGTLFEDGSFEFVPIPDRFHDEGENSETYGCTKGRSGRVLLDYFPEQLRRKYESVSIHADPEFETFTYGDPTLTAKRGLRHLQTGDLLVFYAGLEPWPRGGDRSLYIVGYFEVSWAGMASQLGNSELKSMFYKNFHVKHVDALEDQRERLVLVKGHPNSKLLQKAFRISSFGKDRADRPLKVLSKAMQAKTTLLKQPISSDRSFSGTTSPSLLPDVEDELADLYRLQQVDGLRDPFYLGLSW